MNSFKKIARILVLFGAFLMASCWFFDSVSACTASMTVAGSVSIDISTMDHAGMATDTITVETDCEGGYSVAIGGSSNDSTLYLDGDSTSTSMITTTTGTKINPSAVFAVGENIYANTWGYSITAGTTITSANFIGLTSEEVQIFNKNAASAVGGDDYTVYYGASVSAIQVAGTYMMADGAGIVYYMVPKSLGFEVTGNPTGWTNQDVTLTVVPEDVSEITGYSFDGGTTWQNSPSKVYSANTSGIDIKVKNHDETVSSSKIVDITKIDKVVPTMTFAEDTEYNSDHTTRQVTTLIATLNENTSITTGITATDDLSGVASGWPKCYYNNTEITSTSTFTNVGRYEISCKVQDNAGNETIESREVLIRWPTAGKYVVAKTTIDGAGIIGTGLSSSSSSDGLYRDNASTGANAGLPFASKYYYTGPTVENYLDFAGVTYRILNVSTNDDIKLLGAISDKPTSWGNSKIYDSNVFNTWSTKWWVRGQIYNNETGETHYQLLTDTEKAHVDLATFYAGRLDKSEAVDISYTVYHEQTNDVDLGGDNSPSFEGYSAYPNVSDFLKASKAHDVIDGLEDIDTTSVYSRRQTFTNNSWVDMTAEFWTMNGRTGTLLQDNDFWVIDNDLGGHFEARLYSNTQQYRVVLYLKNDTILSGDGSSLSPYTVEEDWAWFDSTQVLQ